MNTNNIFSTLNPKRKKLTKKAKIIIVCVCIFIALIIFYATTLHKPSITYEMTKPSRGDIVSSISAAGSLSPTNEVEIGSVISGIVLEVLVEENDEVKQGQILARINPETINQQIARFSAQLNSAKAQLKASQQTLKDKKWNYERLKEVYEQSEGRSPSLLELQNAKTAYTAALSDVEIKQASIIEIETSIKSSNIDLKNSHIISPINGVVLSKSVEVGQSVAASFQAPVLFKVAESLEEMVLKANISEADIGKIKEGQEVRFSVDAYQDKRFNAKVSKVNYGSGDGNTSNNNTTNSIVSYIAKIEVDNKSLLLRPDMSATAEIIIEKAENALLVPSFALYFDYDKAMQKALGESKKGSPVNMFAPPPRAKNQFNAKQKRKQTGALWILKDGKPISVEVELGVNDGNFTQILSGIDENTQIITAIKKEQ